MENKEIAWRVIGVVAVVAIVASAGIIFSMVQELQGMTPRDSSVMEQIVDSLRKTDESHAQDD
jgi:flagellar basal body-associated protein FliL